MAWKVVEVTYYVLYDDGDYYDEEFETEEEACKKACELNRDD